MLDQDGGGLKVTKIDSKPSKHMSHTFFTFYLGRELEISNGCTNGRFRCKAIAEVIGTFKGVEEISGEQREAIVNLIYSKARHIGGLANRLWKITSVPVTTWHMPCVQYDGIYELPEESHYFSYFPVECAY